MALVFFKQRDIDEMDINDIPEEFINYFETLDDSGKSSLLKSRPDLAEALGAAHLSSKDVPEETPAELVEPEKSAEVEAEDDTLTQIKENIYKDSDLNEVIGNDMQPLEVLTIPDGVNRCMVHYNPFEEKQVKYNRKGSIYGLVLKVCHKCNRLFLEESKAEMHHKGLKQRKIPHTFYDLDTTLRYLQTQIPVHIMDADEEVYYPDAWIEEHPKCPIHDTDLYETPCEKSYKERKVSFTGYYCFQCRKVILRRTAALDLEERCADAGIPAIQYRKLAKTAPKMKPVSGKDIRPDYYIDNGSRVAYSRKFTGDCFKLTEKDIVVVSDSIYCNQSGHDPKETLALIQIDEKKHGMKSYMFMVGYCGDCQKFYMDIEDYKAVYALGRPAVTIYMDFDDTDYSITSGEVFHLEQSHLHGVEEEIDQERESIKSNPDYVSQYAIGDYDDGGLSYAKARSRAKYVPRLKELDAYAPKPYSYRVDIAADGKTETYYVGAADIVINGKRHVISANSKFGHELVNYQTTKLTKDNKEFSIKLSRQFDIESARLFGYTNLRTDEDSIFKEGITDPFLVRVLKTRRQQHSLTDIFVTIQENQNRIVDVPFEKNLIVQGCAGSGKTMVLLHRLSALNYRESTFDFYEKALILTPNDQFTLHIKGLADDLQIGYIQRASVEQYYMDMLSLYDKTLVPDVRLSSEMYVNQAYVDYIYSGKFRLEFEQAYKDVLGERDAVVKRLQALAERMNQRPRTINLDEAPRFEQQLQTVADALKDLIKQQDFAVGQADEALRRNQSRKQFLEKRVPESQAFVERTMKELLPKVYTKIGVHFSEQQKTISELEEQLTAVQQERERIQSAFFVLRKQARLQELDKDIRAAEDKLNAQKRIQEEESQVLSRSVADLPDEEILDWMRQVMLIINNVADEIRLYERAKDEYKRFHDELSEIDPLIASAEKEAEAARKGTYSMEIREELAAIDAKIPGFRTLDTYQNIFNRTVEAYKAEHEIGLISGRYHRYDLYARLLFALKYFNRSPGKTEFMCIDEGQDLAITEYRLISEL